MSKQREPFASIERGFTRVCCVTTLLFVLGACGGGGGGGGGGSSGATTYAVGGTVSGLNGTLVLRNNGGDDRTLSTNGAFSFATALTDQSNYSVTVATQPLNQTCTVTNGSGAIMGANATGVAIACSTASAAGVFSIFAADDGVHGLELWKTDGTATGTVMVKDITTIGAGSNPAGFAELSGVWYFAADDGTHGMEIWKTDGTDAGTVMVKDINTSIIFGPSSSPALLTVFDNAVYFIADDGVNGIELWKTDGTDTGTQMVKDINPTPGVGSSPNQLTVFNGALYFMANDGVHGNELWKTNGSVAGTQMVKDINPTPGMGSSPVALTVFNGALYFNASDGGTGVGLWKTDGTAAGTVLVKNFNDFYSGVQTSVVHYFSVFNNALYFAADDGVHDFELWMSDGTAGGTAMVKDINPSSGGGGLQGSLPNGFIAFNGALYFAASDGITGPGLWRTDGTDSGTGMVSARALGPHFFIAFNSELYFAASDGVRTGYELWKTDGTDAGTVMVKDIANSLPSGANFSPEGFFILNGALYFAANDAVHGHELWTTDGTTAGTQLLKDICPGVCDGPTN